MGGGGGGGILPSTKDVTGGLTTTVKDLGAGGLAGVGGGILGGPLGAGAAAAQQMFPGIAGGVLNNTPFDPATWGGLGIPGMPGHKGKDPATYGTDMKTPELSNYTGIESLGSAGQLGAATVSASPWMDMATQKQAADQGRLLDSTIQGQQSALAQGRNSLAMKGGLTSGASERMAMQGANDLASARQNVLSQGASERAGLGMQNAQLQTDIGKFNAQQTQGANQFNVGNAINDLANQNSQNRFKYGEEMKMKGGAMSGQAIENSGKK